MSNALLTDLYQLTMLQGYWEQRMQQTAIFEFFVRDLPPTRNFLMAAGLEQALSFLEQFAFSPEDLDWLLGTGRFQKSFVEHLEQLRFTGDVHALAEGTIFFPQEPMLRVTAPIAEAQVVESRLINLLQLQTLIASKAARIVLAAPNKTLVDFGLRRAHGAEAGLLAARAAYIAGFNATATVLAGKSFQIPISGTMAHSFVEAHEQEIEAFAHFAQANPDNVVFLLDTYDTEAAAQLVVTLAPELKKKQIPIRGVRLDSGDLAAHAREVRRILDAGGLAEVKIFASGGLDEYSIRRLIQAGAPIDGFGVGTRLDTSADAPMLDCAYKLVEYAGRPRGKRSEGKSTLPGCKQVFRSYDKDGVMVGDLLALEGESPGGQPLLQPVMQAGRRLRPQPSLTEIRELAGKQLQQLPESLRRLEPAPAYPVEISAGLNTLAAPLFI